MALIGTPEQPVSLNPGDSVSIRLGAESHVLTCSQVVGGGGVGAMRFAFTADRSVLQAIDDFGKASINTKPPMILMVGASEFEAEFKSLTVTGVTLELMSG